MNREDESHEQLIILVSAIFALISCIMSILAITTSGWQIDSYRNKTGLFRTCYQESCTSVRDKHDLSIIFALIGQCLLIFGIIGSFTNAFIVDRRRRQQIGPMCVTCCFIIACLFFWITLFTANFYLLMNGGSAIIFNAAIAFSLLATFTASYATGTLFAGYIDQIHSRTSNVPIKYNQTTMPSELYQYVPTSAERRNTSR